MNETVNLVMVMCIFVTFANLFFSFEIQRSTWIDLWTSNEKQRKLPEPLKVTQRRPKMATFDNSKVTIQKNLRSIAMDGERSRYEPITHCILYLTFVNIYHIILFEGSPRRTPDLPRLLDLLCLPTQRLLISQVQQAFSMEISIKVFQQ